MQKNSITKISYYFDLQLMNFPKQNIFIKMNHA